MKTIGLIGGMSWHSSAEYYRMINESIHEQLGGWHSAKIIMYSVDFDEIDLEHQTDDWQRSDQILINAAQGLENSGAACVVLCANTAHAIYDTIQEHLHIPVLHIADATAEKVKESSYTKVGLLGTLHTMQSDFYKNRLESKHGLSVIVPEESEQEKVHKEINNICLGTNTPEAKQSFISSINNLVQQGAEAVILGCTEISLVLKPEDANVPLFDTTKIHVESTVNFALEE